MVDVENVFIDYFVYKTFIEPKNFNGYDDHFWGIGPTFDFSQHVDQSGTLTEENLREAVRTLDRNR